VSAFLFFHHHTKEGIVIIGAEERCELGFQIALAQSAVLKGDIGANIILLSLLKIKEALADELVFPNTFLPFNQAVDPV